MQAQRHLAISSELSYGIEIRNSTPNIRFCNNRGGQAQDIQYQDRYYCGKIWKTRYEYPDVASTLEARSVQCPEIPRTVVAYKSLLERSSGTEIQTNNREERKQTFGPSHLMLQFPWCSLSQVSRPWAQKAGSSRKK